MKQRLAQLLSVLFLVSVFSGMPAGASADRSVLLTFTGDCTLGSEEAKRVNDNSFDSVVGREGLSYPFEKVRFLFEADDLTVVNLEGVLSDSASGENTAKTYRFRGPAEFVKILSGASVEAAGLANNHTGDYGTRGLEDTQRILSEGGIAWFRARSPYLLEKDGIRVAFYAVNSFQEPTFQNDLNWLRNEIRRVKQDGEADAVIVLFHSGSEYDACHTVTQEKIGKSFIDNGADLIIMHHPHVVQGAAVYANRTMLYSLGNFVFGGNSEIRTKPYHTWEVSSLYSLIARVRLDFSDDGVFLGQAVDLIPAYTSSDAPHNNFQPVPVCGEDAEPVYRAVQYDTAFPLPELTEEDGYSVIRLPYLDAESPVPSRDAN